MTEHLNRAEKFKLLGAIKFLKRKKMAYNKNRDFDVVIFGASGFVGQYVIEELAHSSISTKLKWAIAGRNKEKLRESLKIVQGYLGKEIDITETPLIEADVNNALSLLNLCKRTKLILNCVGPYNLYGEAVIKACIEAGTHHIDLSAETKYLEETQTQYFQAAREKNVYIVLACGMGFLIDDYGISALKKHFPGDLNSVEYFETLKIGPDGIKVHLGTFLSCAVQFWENLFFKDPQEKKLYLKDLPQNKYPLKLRYPPIFYSSEEKRWCVWLLYANSRCLQRSQLFRYNYLNDRPIMSQSYVSMPHFFMVLIVAIYAIFLVIMTRFSFGQSLLAKYPSFFSAGIFSSEGPTRKQVMEGGSKFTFYGQGWKEKLSNPTDQHNTKPDTRMKLTITGPEPAYPLTAMCMVQAGLTVLQEQDKIPLQGGVLTPGVAFENTSLQKRLEKRGVTFKYENIH